jgi:hypothetical protein
MTKYNYFFSALVEALERKDKKSKASAAFMAAQSAVAAEEEAMLETAEVIEDSGGLGGKKRKKEAGRDGAGVFAEKALPLARLSCVVLEAVRPHGFVGRAQGGGNLTLNVVFDVEGEECRAQTRYNPPGSSLVWLDPVCLTACIFHA